MKNTLDQLKRQVLNLKTPYQNIPKRALRAQPKRRKK